MFIEPAMFSNVILIGLQFMPAQIKEVTLDQMSPPQPDAAPQANNAPTSL